MLSVGTRSCSLRSPVMETRLPFPTAIRFPLRFGCVKPDCGAANAVTAVPPVCLTRRSVPLSADDVPQTFIYLLRPLYALESGCVRSGCSPWLRGADNVTLRLKVKAPPEDGRRMGLEPVPPPPHTHTQNDHQQIWRVWGNVQLSALRWDVASRHPGVALLRFQWFQSRREKRCPKN